MPSSKIGTHCVHVSTAMLTKCVREGMGYLSEIIKFRWLKYFHYMQRELGSKGSAELKVLRILRLKKLQGEEIIGK